MQRDLVLRASTGDHAAFASLATDAYSRLHRTAWLILRREDLASDAVQEALTSAWLHIRAVRDPDRFDAWLNRLVVRACYTELRRAKRGPIESSRSRAPRTATGSRPWSPEPTRRARSAVRRTR